MMFLKHTSLHRILRLLSAAGLISLANPSWGLGVELTGVTGLVATNVTNYLKPIKIPDDSTPERYRSQVQRFTVDALKAYGYYTPNIEIFQLDRERVVLTIEPGEQVIVRQLQVAVEGEAGQDEAFQKLLKDSPLMQAEGKPLSHADYELLKTGLSTLAAQRGYFDAEFVPSRIEVRPWEQRADIFLIMHSGKRYTFGEVRYKGSQIEQARLEQMRPFNLNDPYLADDLSLYNQRLSDSGWFRSISVKPYLRTSEDVVELAPSEQAAAPVRSEGRGEAPVNITLTPADRHRFETSIGYATDVGPRTQLTWKQPWVNAEGDSWTNTLYLASKTQRISGTYKKPLSRPLHDRYEFDYGLERVSENDTSSLQAYITPARVWNFANGWEQRIYVRFAQEHFTQADDKDTVFMIMPGIAWARTAVDNTRFPMQGNRQTLKIEGASDQLGSDVSFLRADATTQWIIHLGNDNRFFGRLRGGTTSTQDFHRLPPSLRFFAGGDNSLRGYGYNDIAPRNAAGELVGGENLVIGTLEYQRRIGGNWWAATFVDAGNVFDHWQSGDIKRSAGIGIRWQTVVGPIRLDIAHPFDNKEDAWRLHFAIGPEF